MWCNVPHYAVEEQFFPSNLILSLLLRHVRKRVKHFFRHLYLSQAKVIHCTCDCLWPGQLTDNWMMQTLHNIMSEQMLHWPNLEI